MASEVGLTRGPTTCSGLGCSHGSHPAAEELPSSPTGHDARPPLPSQAVPDLAGAPWPLLPHLFPSLWEVGSSFLPSFLSF